MYISGQYVYYIYKEMPMTSQQIMQMHTQKNMVKYGFFTVFIECT